MKLDKLHKSKDIDILRRYLKDLRKLCESKESRKLLSEAKITITIDDDEDRKPQVVHHHHGGGISNEAKVSFIERAKAIGDFNNEAWVNSLVKSMEQAGVQGFHKICEDEKPVTNKQIQQLIGLLVDLVSSN